MELSEKIFSEKVFIVTGASSGIGKSCAEQILRLGGTAAGVDINEGTVSDPRYTHHRLDILDEDKVISCVREVAEKHGSIDGLVNAAGIWGCGKPFYDMDADAFRRTVSVNTVGTFIMSKHAAKEMIPRGRGKIVNISCIRASVFRDSMADYAASKGAVVSLTSAMALDLAPYNIQVNSVAPGFTLTGMTAASLGRPEVREQSEKLIPQGRVAMPEDISSVVVFLLSELSDYMTGANIFADGGYRIQK